MNSFYRGTDGKGNIVPVKSSYRVLQQWWEDADFLPGTGEWRDVPLEAE
jgi:hypothetical protein